MAEYNKTSRLKCLLSFLAAAGFAITMCLFFEGPRLGFLYDFLLRQRPGIPVSREILVIDLPGNEFWEAFLEPETASSLFYSMAELGAGTLIIQAPILGRQMGGASGDAEILRRFDEEFSILNRNIKNLFGAIRAGSVAPGDSERYVGELVELSEMGKDRLVSSLLGQDAESAAHIERAAAFFGRAKVPGDLEEHPLAGSSPEIFAAENTFSRAERDWDGIIRRVSPKITNSEFPEENNEKILQHIVYSDLKTRFAEAKTDAAPEFFGFRTGTEMMILSGHEGTEKFIPLDRNGAVLFELPRKGEDFRRISVSDFLRYDEADKNLRRILSEAEKLGFFRGIDSERRPDVLYDFALSLREEFSSHLNGGDNGREIWIEARNRYFLSLNDFILAPPEINMLNSNAETTGRPELTETENAAITAFSMLETELEEVLELREKLQNALVDSFSILGISSQNVSTNENSFFRNFNFPAIDGIRSAFARPNFTDVEASAFLANSILTGRAVKNGANLYLLAGSILASLIVCLAIKSTGAFAAFTSGILLVLLILAGSSAGFIISGVWFNPLIPSGSAALGVLVSFLWELLSSRHHSKNFRVAYGPYISRTCLKSVIQAGKPLPEETVSARAAVVAVKNSEPSFRENSASAHLDAVLAFQGKAGDLFKKAGGTIIALEEEIVTACFGSPLERVFLKKGKLSPYDDDIYAKRAPAMRAVDIVSDIARQHKDKNWHFGIDMGNCSFAWSAPSGYFAVGAPVQRARLLSRLAARYQGQILISSSVNEVLPDLAVKKLNYFKKKDGSPGNYFYGLKVKK